MSSRAGSTRTEMHEHVVLNLMEASIASFLQSSLNQFPECSRPRSLRSLESSLHSSSLGSRPRQSFYSLTTKTRRTRMPTAEWHRSVQPRIPTIPGCITAITKQVRRAGLNPAHQPIPNPSHPPPPPPPHTHTHTHTHTYTQSWPSATLSPSLVPFTTSAP